jgi:hypothetical protein
MIGLGAVLTLDARGFNQTAEKVVAKTRQMAQKVAQSGGPKISAGSSASMAAAQRDAERLVALKSQAAAKEVKIAERATAAKRALQERLNAYKSRAMPLASGLAGSQGRAVAKDSEALRKEEERAAAKREMDGTRTARRLQESNTRSWRAQQREQLAMLQSAQSEKLAKQRGFERESAALAGAGLAGGSDAVRGAAKRNEALSKAERGGARRGTEEFRRLKQIERDETKRTSDAAKTHQAARNAAAVSGPKVSAGGSAAAMSELDQREVERLVALKSKAAADDVKITNQANAAKRASQEKLDAYNKSSVAMSGASGLAGSRGGQQQQAAKDREGLRKEEEHAAKREMEAFARQDRLQKENARSWRAQQKEQLAMFQAAQADKKASRMQADRESADDHKRFVAQQKRATTENRALNKEVSKGGQGSFLGGGAKMFAGFLTAGFLINKTKAAIDHADALTAMGKRLNSNTEDLDAWDKALKTSGSSIEEMAPFLDKLNKNRVAALGGNTKQMDAASVLGLSTEQLKTMGATDLALQGGKAIESGQNTEAVIAAMQTMGGDGAIAFITALQDGLRQGIEDIKESGDAASATVTATIKSVGDRFTDITSALQTGFGRLVSIFGPFAANLAESIILPFQVVGRFFGSFIKSGGSFTEGFGAIGDLWEEQDKKQKEREAKIAEAAEPFAAKPVNVDVENKKELARKEREEAKLEKQVEREMERRQKENAELGKHSVNSMQQMGAFFGNAGLAAGPEVAALNAQVEARDILREMRDIMKKKKGGSSDPDIVF